MNGGRMRMVRVVGSIDLDAQRTEDRGGDAGL